MCEPISLVALYGTKNTPQPHLSLCSMDLSTVSLDSMTSKSSRKCWWWYRVCVGEDIIGCVGVHESVGGYYFVEGCFFLIFYNYDNVICGKMFSPKTYCFQLLFFFYAYHGIYRSCFWGRLTQFDLLSVFWNEGQGFFHVWYNSFKLEYNDLWCTEMSLTLYMHC